MTPRRGVQVRPDGHAVGPAAPYGRTFGAILAFLVVALFTKFANVLLTYELAFEPPVWNARVSQVWMSLRFAWQEFAIVAVLLGVVAAWQRRVPTPGRATRAMLWLLRAGLIVGAAVSVAGIKYYELYHGPVMVTDFLENFLWAVQLAGSAKVFRSPLILFGAISGALLLFGVPWFCARLPARAAARLGVTAFALASVMSAGMWAAGRPRLTEAQLEPNPLLWFFWGPQATYFEPATGPQLAPVGPQVRRFSVAQRPRNVILVVLESVPARALAAYEPSAAAGRRLLEEFGDEITTFDQIFSAVPISDSGFLSMFTGRNPVPTNKEALENSRGRPVLPEILQRRGSHNEFLLTGPSNALRADLVGRGFDRIFFGDSAWPGPSKYASLTWGPDDRILFDYARTFLEAQRVDSPPFFLVLVTSNAHYPYDSGRIPGLQDHADPKERHARITAHLMDLLADMYARLKATGMAESTLLLALGDHGQAFGEHRGNYVHSKELYAENLHVPMFLMHPTRLGLPPRISQLGSLIDVMPTVLDVMSIEPPPMDGMSLLNDAPERVIFHMTPFGPGVAGFRTARYFYSLSRTGRELLFDRIADPLERHDIVSERPDVAAQFRARLRGTPAPR